MVIKRSALQKGAQFNMLIIDRDHGGDIDDLIDYFSIPINISAGSSLTSNFTGVYNYTQLELTIEVACTSQNNTDESCVCVSGFTGPLCELDVANDCTAAMPCAFSDSTKVPGIEMTTSSSTSSSGPAASAVPVAAITGGVVGGLAAAFFLIIIIITLLLLFIIKSRTKAQIGMYAQSP